MSLTVQSKLGKILHICLSIWSVIHTHVLCVALPEPSASPVSD